MNTHTHECAYSTITITIIITYFVCGRYVVVTIGLQSKSESSSYLKDLVFVLGEIIAESQYPGAELYNKLVSRCGD